MSLFLFNNNVRVAFASSVSDSANSITFTNPSAPFNLPATPAGGVNGVLTLVDSVVAPTKVEVVTYTGITDNGNGTHTLTGVTRAQEGTTAQSFLAGEFGYQALTRATLNALKGMALQAPNAVDIDGGVIDGTVIGQTNPSTGVFTTLLATSVATFNTQAEVKAVSDSAQFKLTRTGTSPGSGWLGANNTRSFMVHSGDLTKVLQFSVAHDAPSNSVLIGATGTSIAGTLSTTGSAAIGTSVDANYRLTVAGGAGPLSAIRAGVHTVIGQSGGEYGGVGYNVRFTTTSGSFAYNVSDTASYLQFASGGFQFRTAASGTAGNALTLTERMRITQDGNVGIGTTDPGAKVDIVGAARASIGFEYDAEVDDGTSGTSKTINWTTGHRRRLLMSGNCTITFTAPSKPCSLILKLTTSAGSGATQTITWPASIRWAGGAIPDHRTGNSDTHIFSFYFDGANYYGSAMLDCS